MSAEPRSPRVRDIVAAAGQLLEAEGPDALTMRRLADRLGVRAPSLYKHLPGKGALEAALIADGLDAFADEIERAERGPRDPLDAVAGAIRSFARRRPHRYRLMTGGPLPDDPAVAAANARATAPVVRAAGGEDTARAAWAFAHGMLSLELAGRFPPGADVDAAWRAGLEAFRQARPDRRLPDV